MKKKFKDTKLGKFFQSKGLKTVTNTVLGIVAPPLKIGVGVTGGVIAGITESLRDEAKTNLESDLGGTGKPNIPRIIGYLILATVTILLLLGKIDGETFNLIFDSWNNVEN